MTLTWTQSESALKRSVAKNSFKVQGHIKKEWQIKMMAVFSFSHSHRNFHSRYITASYTLHSTVKPRNIIAYKKGFKFHAQPKTGTYSC